MDMKNTGATTDQMIEALKKMSIEERIAYLQANRPELFDSRIVSFGKAPKGGWTDADKVTK